MEVSFTKLHGCANDYLFVDCLAAPLERAPEVARLLSDRRRGVGSDGLICICPGENADFRMEMYNADGSSGKMCGNGIRGFGKYVFDHGLSSSRRLEVETDAGLKTLDLELDGQKVSRVTVDMGPAVLDGRSIPVDADGEIVNADLQVAGRGWTVTCVSMGNPHCVTFDEDPDGLDLCRLGPGFESHPFFPEGVNTEFARVDSAGRISMRVWERGSGETMACGTGACAVVVAAAITGRADRDVVVSLRGGDLEISYRQDGGVTMTGPAVEVFSATVDLDLS